MEQSDNIRDFATLISDRRLEIDGQRWRSIVEAKADRSDAPNRSRPMGIDQPVIVPARSVEQWITTRGRALEIQERLPADYLEAGNAAQLSFGARFSQLLRYSVLPLRLQPLSSTHEHRCIPSGGNSHAVELRVATQVNGEAVVHRLNPHDMRLVEEQRVQRSLLIGDSSHFEIILVGCLGRVVKTYGEFGLGLVLVEAGLLQAQLAMLGGHLGMEPRAMTKHEVSTAASLLSAIHWSEVPLAGLLISADDDGTRLRELEVTNHIPVETHKDLKGRKRLRAVVDAIHWAYAKNGQHELVSFDANYHDMPHTTPFTATMTRSSGSSDWDDTSRPLTVAEIEGIVRPALFVASGMRQCGEANDLATLVVSRNREGEVRSHCVTARGRMEPCALRPGGIAAANALMPRGVSATVTIHADDRFASCGDAARFADAFIQAGRLTQSIGLWAARIGAYARPQKAFPDSLVNAQLAIDRRSLLQIQIGFASHHNPAYPLQ
jgi:hypothetical protein